MDHNERTSDKVDLNRLSIVSEDDEDHESALTIVSVLDKVATIVDTVQASQKRIEERHREMENAIKTIQIDLLKLAQAHSNTSYTVNKLLEKTRKVSTNVKDVRSRVDRQSDQVLKVESKQEEMLRKNKFRVVIFQVCNIISLAEMLLSAIYSVISGPDYKSIRATIMLPVGPIHILPIRVYLLKAD